MPPKKKSTTGPCTESERLADQAISILQQIDLEEERAAGQLRRVRDEIERAERETLRNLKFLGTQ